jgi:anti-sigma factor RsiW
MTRPVLSCRDIPRLADAAIDRDGPVRDRIAVAFHLRLCRDCRTYVAGLRQTRRLVAASLRGPAPEALVADLVSRVAGRSPDDGDP